MAKSYGWFYAKNQAGYEYRTANQHFAALTQEQTVAKMQLMELDISKSTYAKIETNRMNIKVSELLALKEIFHVSFDDFFTGLDEEK